MKSIWYRGVEMPEFKHQQGDIKTDVLIIGGGIAGILTAHFLEQRGVKYVLVQKGRILSGVTGNTTAKITFQHGLNYHKILNNSGEEAAKAYLSANRAAAEIFWDMCKKVNCDFEKKDNFVYSKDNRKILEDEMRALQIIGYNAEFCEDVSIPVKTVGAVKFSDQAQFNPLKFFAEIAKPLNILENTFVKEISDNTAITDYGKIFAKKILVTTHFPFINKHGLFFLKLYQHRSYALALQNAENVNGMYVDENKKGLSFRNYDNLLLLAGGAHRTGKQGGNWNEVRKFARRFYPKSEEIAKWAAQDCMSLDSIPYIGNYSKNTPNLFVASGFNKWGMTSAMLSAMILSDLVIEKKNDFAEFFDPSRSILRPQLLLNIAETTVNMLTPTLRRCPHLGCALKYNTAEHSWDCACHGSRFSEYGEVLNNPANGDIR